MSPYDVVRQTLQSHGSSFMRAALDAVLSLMAESYSGDIDPSDRPFDYVLRRLDERFGVRHPITLALFHLRTETNL